LHIDELIVAMTSLIPCNAAAPLEADLRVRLLLNDDDEASSSSAELLRFRMVEEEIVEEGRTGVDGGITSSSLELGLLIGIAGGPIPPAVLPLGAESVEFAIALKV
jgi:hypothetical protein